MAQAPFTFADLFAGIGGFHAALAHAEWRCVYVSEIDDAARGTYLANWVDHLPDERRPAINEDINTATPSAATSSACRRRSTCSPRGSPANPSLSRANSAGWTRRGERSSGTSPASWRSGSHRSSCSRTCGTLWAPATPTSGSHRQRTATDRVPGQLHAVGVLPHLPSPVTRWHPTGSRPCVHPRDLRGPGKAPDPDEVPPTLVRAPVDGWDPMAGSVEWAFDDEDEIENLHRYELSPTERGWIDFWDELVQELPQHNDNQRLPGFPLWADHWVPEDSLRVAVLDLSAAVEGGLPGQERALLRRERRRHRSLARGPEVHGATTVAAQARVAGAAPTSLWETVMHFRPSGIRCKQPTYLPALVAITQTSIIGPRQRRLTPHEAARLQGLPRSFRFGKQRDAASYKQVGNGVCVGAAWHALRVHVERDQADIPEHVVSAILGAPRNPSPDSCPPRLSLIGQSRSRPAHNRWARKAGTEGRSAFERGIRIVLSREDSYSVPWSTGRREEHLVGRLVHREHPRSNRPCTSFLRHNPLGTTLYPPAVRRDVCRVEHRGDRGAGEGARRAVRVEDAGAEPVPPSRCAISTSRRVLSSPSVSGSKTSATSEKAPCRPFWGGRRGRRYTDAVLQDPVDNVLEHAVSHSAAW